MSKFHLYHISFFDSLLKGLMRNGVPLGRLMSQSYIRRFDLNNPNTYLPLEVAYEFLENVKLSQGIDCISSEFYGGFKVEDLSDYGQYLAHCPDLYSILQNCIKYDYLVMTNSRYKLKTEGALSWFSCIQVDSPSNGREISEQINLAMILKGFQLVLGPDWVPLELHITSANGYWLKKLLPTFDFKLKTNCTELKLVFKTSELAAKNKYYSDNYTIGHTDNNSIEATTVKVFSSLNGYYLPTLEEFSGYFGYSKRTILREFSNTETSYKELAEKHLFMAALRMLEGQALSVDDISFRLGYAHPSNFIRAFKRWAGTTPNEYRMQVSVIAN